MKCLHILPMNKLSGAEKLVLILCKNMKKYKPVVICGGDNLNNIFRENGIESYSMDFSIKNIKSTLSQIKTIIKENDIKVVHAHDNNASINALLAKKIYGLRVKVISHIHSCYPWLSSLNKNKIIDYLFRKNYDHNIACGSTVYDFYRKNTHYINEGNTSTLSNAIDMEEIDNISKENILQIYDEYDIPKDKVILGYVGRLIELKGIVPFIKKVKENEEKFQDCRILLVGDGPQEEEIKSLIKELNLEYLFILTGFQSDVYKFYPIIDIFFLTSKYEGLPMVILEAMSFEIPIISMNVGSINEVVKNDYNGYLVNPGDYDDFLKRLLEVKSDKSKIESYGKKSRKIIYDNYNIDDYVEKIISIYDK